MNNILIDYWRNSIADTQRMSPATEGTSVFDISPYEIKSGKIEPDVARNLVEALRAEVKRWDKNAETEKIETAPVALTPFILHERLEHTHRRKKGDTKAAAAIWISATVDLSGTLHAPDVSKLPWIDRACLEPVATRSFVVGSVKAVDEYLEVLKLPESLTWPELISFAEKFWTAITTKDLFKPDFAEYAVTEGRIALFSEKGGAGAKLIEFCDRLRDYELVEGTPADTALHALLSRATVPEDAADVYLPENSKLHTGHIGGLTLAPSQRHALGSILSSGEASVVAVNGPPGTGKTTLVQSILASEVVNAAVLGKEPFIALACSTNNQAVTNLIDSLGKAAQPIDDDLLSQRWIPEAHSLGLYFPSQDALKKVEDGKYLTAGLRQPGFPEQIEDETFIEAAETRLTALAKTYFHKEPLSFDEVTPLLHQQLTALHKRFKQFIDQTTTLKAITTARENAGHLSLERWLKHTQEKLDRANIEAQEAKAATAEIAQELEKQKQEALSIRRRVLGKLDPANLVELLLGFLPDIRRRKISRAIEALETSGFVENAEKLYEPSTQIADVSQICNTIVAKAQNRSIPDDVRARQNHALEAVDAAKAALQNVQNCIQRWDDSWVLLTEIIQQVNLETGNIHYVHVTTDSLRTKYQENLDGLIDQADLSIRRRLFFIALRYWESRWISAVKNLSPEDKKKQGEKFVRERYRRYAMLTPCFVATFYKAAAAFRHFGKAEGPKDETPKMLERPLRKFFDLLIVDEAGQVAPEIGAPCFFLAKRAAVVGDTMQIPPVVTLNKYVDIGNLHKHGLSEQHDDLDQRGYVSHTGNVMRMAQNATRFTLPKTGGMFLSEHRRCFDEIIGYCNRFYQGRLEPKRGAGPAGSRLPSLGYAHIQGKAERISGSWTNHGEARAIADWLARNGKKLEEFYKLPIGEIIAVVTPFRRQSAILRTELEKQKIPTGSKAGAVTVGTIHSLQGAERPVVLFSSVYDRNVEQGYFFDSDDSMLNVAISRAKDSFIVFGDMNIFRPESKKNSAHLAELLFSSENNEIKDVDSAQIILDVAQNNVEHLATLEQHRKFLNLAITSAKKKLLIVSPYLSYNALTADNIPPLIAQAKARGVNIRIATCENNLRDARGNAVIYAHKALSLLESSGNPALCIPRIHNKTLAIDDTLLIEGSFNWLSASRDQDSANQERSLAYRGKEVRQFIEQAWLDTEPEKQKQKKSSD